MKKLIIGYSPFENKTNSYVESFKRILTSLGQVVKTPSLKEIVRFRFRRDYDLLILNWSDNGFVSEKSGSINAVGVIKAFSKALILRLVTKKIIFVRHNVYPHNTSLRSKKIVVKLLDIYERLFDSCWVHSGHLTKNHRLYVPHPLYPVSATEHNLFSTITLPNKYFVIFGRIIPYKNIDKLIEVLPDEVNLVVCGSCSDLEYLEKLTAYKRNNVTIIAKYLSDDLAKDIISKSSGVVICHSDEDMIVSGSLIFAISAGVPVIAIETPFIAWFRASVNSRMVVSATCFSELRERMRIFNPEIDSADIVSTQEHFCDQSVRSKVIISLNRLDLI